MAEERPLEVPSTARIAGHPIHPMLIPFPIALLPAALVTDLVYVFSADGFWAIGSKWLVFGGLVTGVAAAVPGLIDFATIARARIGAGWIHLAANVAVLGLALVSLLLRWEEPEAAVMPSGIILSGVIAGLLVVAGWFGGELAYRYRVGTFSKED